MTVKVLPLVQRAVPDTVAQVDQADPLLSWLIVGVIALAAVFGRDRRSGKSWARASGKSWLDFGARDD